MILAEFATQTSHRRIRPRSFRFLHRARGKLRSARARGHPHRLGESRVATASHAHASKRIDVALDGGLKARHPSSSPDEG